MSQHIKPTDIYGIPYHDQQGQAVEIENQSNSSRSNSSRTTSTHYSGTSGTPTSNTDVSAFNSHLYTGQPPFVPPRQFNESAESLPSQNHTQRAVLNASDPNDPTHQTGYVAGKNETVMWYVDHRTSRNGNSVVVHNRPKERVRKNEKGDWDGYRGDTDMGPAYATDGHHSEDCRKRTRRLEYQDSCLCAPHEH